MAPLLQVKDLTLRRDEGTGSALFANVSFDVEEGDIIIIKGRSGSGKTTLLKCLAQLVLYTKGEILFRGKEPEAYGIPRYRTRVLYVPQRPSMLPGTPDDFLKHIASFSSRSSHPSTPQSASWWSSHAPAFLGGSKSGEIALPESTDDAGPRADDSTLDPYELAKAWGIPRGLWARGWGDLSGGEAQRIALATALSRGAGLGGGGEIVLLDEPTSALDPETTAEVEKSLLELLPPSSRNPHGKGRKGVEGGGPKAYLLITHSAEQAERLAGKGAKVVDLGGAPEEVEEEGEDDRRTQESTRDGNGKGKGKD